MVYSQQQEQRMWKSPLTPVAKSAANVQQIDDALSAIYSILEINIHLKEAVSFTLSAKQEFDHGKLSSPQGTSTVISTTAGNHNHGSTITRKRAKGNHGSTITSKSAKPQLGEGPSLVAPSEIDSLPQIQSRKHRWEKVFDFVGPDSDTSAMLRRNQEAWTQEPQQFVRLKSSPPQPNIHPLLIVASVCMQLEFEQVWARMLRRAWCVIYSRLEKEFDMPIAQLAEMMFTAFDYPTADIERKLTHYSTAGSRYECWIKDFGEGVIFYFGIGIEEFVWERAAKSGEAYEKALTHLQSIHLREQASQYTAMGKSILKFMWTEVFKRCGIRDEGSREPFTHYGSLTGGQMWCGSLNTYASSESRSTRPNYLVEVDEPGDVSYIINADRLSAELQGVST